MKGIAGPHADRMLPNLDAVLPIRESTVAAGPAAGTRVIDIPAWDGIAIRVLPDRGFDLGQAWYRGVPLAWVSTAGETGPLRDLRGMAWSGASAVGCSSPAGCGM